MCLRIDEKKSNFFFLDKLWNALTQSYRFVSSRPNSFKIDAEFHYRPKWQKFHHLAQLQRKKHSQNIRSSTIGRGNEQHADVRIFKNKWICMRRAHQRTK